MPFFDKQRKVRVVASMSLVLLTLLLYLPVGHHDFLKLWDDDAYVTDNPHVRTGLTLSNIAWAFTSFEQSNWHPVTWISHMLDCQLYGLNPEPQHYENLIWHVANVVLLFWILRAVTGAVARSFIVAALFAAHPLNVETVAWIAQRKSLLSAFFSLLTIAAYGWYVRSGGRTRYLAMVFAFALALMSKPMAVSLPLLLLFFDYWPLARLTELPFPRRWTKLTIEKFPLFLMSTAGSVLTERAQSSGGSVMGLSLLPVPTRIENAVISYIAYIGKIVWPARLATYYPIRFSPAVGDVVASAIILVVVSALALYLRKFPYVATGWLLFIITLIPVIGIVQVGFQGMADRYTYIPAIGLFIAIVWGISDIVAETPGLRKLTWKVSPHLRDLGIPTSVPIAASVTGILAIGVLSTVTSRYLPCWKSNVTLFAQARSAWGQPDMWLEQLYGNALFSAGRTDEALQHYGESCRIQPRTEYCHYNIAHILAGRGQFIDAIAQYQLALQYTRNRDMALLCLTESAEALLRLGEFDAAEKSISQALTIDPTNSIALQLQQQIIHGRGGVN